MVQLLFLSLLLALGTVDCASVDEWMRRSVYQIMTDRFALTDDVPSPCDTSERRYCGGTWKGIARHLDYIEEMGFDAIWISPVSSNIEGNTTNGEAFHGYWTKDLGSLNSRFGTPDDLKELSRAVHAKGMLLMFDVVVNHVAAPGLKSLLPNETSLLDNVTTNNFTPTLPPAAYDFSPYSPFFEGGQSFHKQCFIKDYSNQTEVESCWLGDKDLPLPDINTEHPVVVEKLNKWIAGLVKTYGVDGLRLDTLKHVRKDFWPGFARASGVFTLGEVISDNTTYTGAYTDVVDSILDYPTWFPLTAAFSSPAGNLSALIATAEKTQGEYKGGSFRTASFIENHDQPRFQSITKDRALVRNAMVWPFVHDGLPVTYYGQEQGFDGANDPANREALWSSGYATDKPLVGIFKSLNNARKAAIESKDDKFLETPMKFIPQMNNATMVVSKPPLLALFTNVGAAGYQKGALSKFYKVLRQRDEHEHGEKKNSTHSSSAVMPATSGSMLDVPEELNATTIAHGAPVVWEIPRGIFSSREMLVDVLTCDRLNVGEDGSLSVSALFGMPKVLIAASKLNKNGKLCPASATGSWKLNKNEGLNGRSVSWSVVGGAAVIEAVRYWL